MGLTPRQYYLMTRAEFILAYRGFRKSKVKEWEHSRFVAYWTYATAQKKGPNKSIHHWFPLPTDPPVTDSIMSKEEYLESLKLATNGRTA